MTKGLLAKYGPERVRDTPIAELGFTGAGVGAAIAGLRPVVEWMTHNFALLAMDQVVNEAAKLRYMSGGKLSVPIVFRGPNGPAEYLASQHSQSFASFWSHVPGLKVLAPSTPADAYGLLKSAIRDDNPVVFLESELIYAWKGEVADERVPRAHRQGGSWRGRERTSRSSAFSRPMRAALEAADSLAAKGVDAEVLDLRSLRPLDEAAVYESVRKTGQLRRRRRGLARREHRLACRLSRLARVLRPARRARGPRLGRGRADALQPRPRARRAALGRQDRGGGPARPLQGGMTWPSDSS